MHVIIALFVGLVAWIAGVFLTDADPYMIILAPFVISAVTLICCLWPRRRRRAPAFESGILGSSLER